MVRGRPRGWQWGPFPVQAHRLQLLADQAEVPELDEPPAGSRRQLGTVRAEAQLGDPLRVGRLQRRQRTPGPGVDEADHARADGAGQQRAIRREGQRAGQAPPVRPECDRTASRRAFGDGIGNPPPPSRPSCPGEDMPSPGVEPGLRPSQSRVPSVTPRGPRPTCPARESNPVLRLRRPPRTPHARGVQVEERPRGESNPDRDLRRVACRPPHSEGRGTRVPDRIRTGSFRLTSGRAAVITTGTAEGEGFEPSRPEGSGPFSRRARPTVSGCLP